MVNAAADLAKFIQRRELLAYETRLARMVYAYGADRRRSSWLDHSLFGEPLIRSVDRRWNKLVATLQEQHVMPASEAPPMEVMEELARMIRLLRAPLPTLRVSKAGADPSAWPIVTALGTTKGASHWLVLDTDRLMALDPVSRTFMLAQGVGNLQCEHGPMYAAHLMAHLAGRGLGLVRTMLRPWSRVSVFSADRAALLAIGELEPTLEALRIHADPGVTWLPPMPPVSLRVEALQDFDKSRVMVRLRMMYTDPGQWTIASQMRTPGGFKLEMPNFAADKAKGEDEKTELPPEPETPPEPPPEKNSALEEALAAAWSLARCDVRLTRKLGLL